MARDVEFNVTASDKTGMALAEAEAKFKASQERIRKEGKKTGDSLGDSVKKGVDKGSLEIFDQLKKRFGLAGMSGGELLATGLVAASPLIGAAISAAVIGGAGVGGVLGGVYLASKDPRVQAAGAELGQSLLSSLEKDAAVFVDPVLHGIDKIEGAFAGMNGRISHIFSSSAGFLAPLEDGVIGAVKGILRGVDALVTKGKPVIDQLGASFTELGTATGKSLEVISGDSEDSAKALQDLTHATSITILGVGYLVRGLTELYGAVTVLPHIWVDAAGKLTGLNDAMKWTGVQSYATGTAQAVLKTAVMSTGEAAGKAGMQMTTFADSMSDAASKGRGLYDSQTDVAQAVADTKSALDKNGRSLDLNSEKGRANRKVLSDLAGKYEDNYAAFVKLNGEGAAAQKVAEKNRAAFVQLATAFTGSKQKAEALATQMGLIPTKKDTDFHANTHDAAARIAALQGQVDGLHGKTIGVHVSVTGAERLNTLGHRIGGFSAAGMSWAAADRNSGMSRTGGPTPVSVNNSFGVYINGVMDRRSTVQVVDERSARDAWRQKVGRRK